jgi:hypothetical protein
LLPLTTFYLTKLKTGLTPIIHKTIKATPQQDSFGVSSMSTKTLTKTQSLILARAEKTGFVSVEMFGGRGSEGGKISGGVREYRALSTLIHMGFLDLVNTQRETSNPGNGYTIHHYILRAKTKGTI